jgi:C4-dicarboxylate transporter DctM subunit
MTGSAVSDTTAIGSILIPAMIDNGYEKDVTVAITATSSVIGVIIPPSIVVVIYAIVAEVSVGDLLLAGIVPGILLGLALMAAVAVIARRRGYQSVAKLSIRNILRTFRRSFLSLITVIIVVGGIYGGIFTPTEASIIAAVYAFILSTLVYRELNWREIRKIFVDTATVCSLGLFLLGTTSIFGWIVATQQIPQIIFDFVMSVTANKTILLLSMILLLLLIGTVLESVAAILILVPILAPIGLNVGLDPIHFGMIIVLAIALGLSTPPVGVCIFVACGLANAQVSSVMKAIIPFFLVSLAVLLLVAFIPQISLFIPNLMR